MYCTISPYPSSKSSVKIFVFNIETRSKLSIKHLFKVNYFLSLKCILNFEFQLQHLLQGMTTPLAGIYMYTIYVGCTKINRNLFIS